MRKLAALLCLALMFLSIAGCNSPTATESQSRPNKDQQNDAMRYGPGLVIHHETPNLEQLAQRVFENFLQFEESKGCPETSRIKDYRIESIQMKDSNATDLVFSVSYAILPATDQYCLAGNGQREKDGWISHIFNFVKVHRKDNTFKIVETATSPIPNLSTSAVNTKIDYKLTGKLPDGWLIDFSGPNRGKITKDGKTVGLIETVGYYGGPSSLPNHSTITEKENVVSGLGKGVLYILDRSTPAASPTQKTWPEIFVLIPVAGRSEALSVSVDTDKASLKNDVTVIKMILQKLTSK